MLRKLARPRVTYAGCSNARRGSAAHDVVLEVCRKLRLDGAFVEGAFEYELEVLERNDIHAAVDLLDQYLAVHPGDRVIRLRRTATARAVGYTEQPIDPDSMPPARDVSPPLGGVAVRSDARGRPS